MTRPLDRTRRPAPRRRLEHPRRLAIRNRKAVLRPGIPFRREGRPSEQAILLGRAGDIDWERLSGATRVGLTAGASAPEILVEEVLAAFGERFDVTVEPITVTEEDVQFKLPKVLQPAVADA